jgi:hypothetical protein
MNLRVIGWRVCGVVAVGSHRDRWRLLFDRFLAPRSLLVFVCLFVCELITSCSSNGISYTYFLIVKGYFKILCWTNTAPMHSLEHWYTYSTVAVTKLDQWKMCVLGQERLHKPPAKTCYTNILRPSLIIAFTYLNLCCLVWPRLAQYSA